MKKFLFSIFALLMLLSTGDKAYAAEQIDTVGSSAVLYYSPSDGWTKTSGSGDAIKVTKSADKYYVDQKLAFTIKSDYNFISNNTFVAVDNNKLKFYTPKYENEKFGVEEMKPDEVQKLFKAITVLPVSKFDKGGLELKRIPYEKEVYLLVNDTDRDFTGYAFSPTSVHQSQLSGLFVASRSRNIRYLTERTDRSGCLSMYVRTDGDAPVNGDNSYASAYGEYKVFDEK